MPSGQSDNVVFAADWSLPALFGCCDGRRIDTRLKYQANDGVFSDATKAEAGLNANDDEGNFHKGSSVKIDFKEGGHQESRRDTVVARSFDVVANQVF